MWKVTLSSSRFFETSDKHCHSKRKTAKRRRNPLVMRKQYIKKGKCIFCGKSYPEITFFDKPHTTPHSLGSDRIGFDVCDKCNHFFGEPDKSIYPRLAVETCVKEIFGVIRFMLNLEREGHEKDTLKSRYFNFWRSRNTLQFKTTFKHNSPYFRRIFIKQFKRGLYELFLQEYHMQTGNGLDARFDRVRRYARYGYGDIPIWHLQTRLLLLEADLSIPALAINEHAIEEIDTYGFYSMYLWGFWFYLEVTPRAELAREVYLRKVAKDVNVGSFVVEDLVQLKDVDDIDYTLRQLYGGRSF